MKTKSNIQNDKSISETPNKQNYHSDKIISSDVLTQQFNFGCNETLKEVEKMIDETIIDLMNWRYKDNPDIEGLIIKFDAKFLLESMKIKLKQLEKKE